MKSGQFLCPKVVVLKKKPCITLKLLKKIIQKNTFFNTVINV